MKIKVTQLDQATRSTIAAALRYWARTNEEDFPMLANKYQDMAHSIKHGELILCEYQYNEQEKGGE